MNHQTFNKKSYGFLLYFTFQGLLTPLLSAFIPYYIELLPILLQNYNPVATKTDIGRRKDEEGRLNCRWNTFDRKSHRQQTLCCFCVDLMFAFNSAFFHTSGKSCWKSFMVACKHMKKNTQVVQSASSDVSVSWYRRLDKLTDTSPLAYAVIFVTRCSHIRNPTQPYS